MGFKICIIESVLLVFSTHSAHSSRVQKTEKSAYHSNLHCEQLHVPACFLHIQMTAKTGWRAHRYNSESSDATAMSQVATPNNNMNMEKLLLQSLCFCIAAMQTFQPTIEQIKNLFGSFTVNL